MPNTVINAGQVALFNVNGADASGAPAPVTGTVTVSDYTSAYIVSTGKKGEYMLVPKITLQPGQKVSVTATFSAVASDGSVIADFSVGFELDGAVQPPATQLILSGVSTPNAVDVTVPADPGSATIGIF